MGSTPFSGVQPFTLYEVRSAMADEITKVHDWLYTICNDILMILCLSLLCFRRELSCVAFFIDAVQ